MSKSITLTEEEIAEVFEEWDRQYQDDPEGHMTDEEITAMGSESYGKGAAMYFVRLHSEMHSPDEGKSA